MKIEIPPQDAPDQRIISTIWQAARYVGFPETEGRLVHISQAFDPEWLASLEVPIGEQRRPEQRVILMDDHEFDRSAQTPEAVARARAQRPRTLVYENLARENQGWIRRVCQTLGALTGQFVACSANESRTGDAAIFPHYDDWFGIAIQWGNKGAKDWSLYTDTGIREIRTRAGDILVLPTYIKHAVSTPADPGHSLHLSFSFHANIPLGTSAG